MAVLPLEKDFLKEIISVLYEFLWRGKDKVKRTAVISDIQDGGLRMVDIETMIKAIQIMVVKIYLDNSHTGLPLDLPVFYRASTGQRYFIVIVYAASGSPLGSRVFSSRRPPSCFPLVDCCWTCVSLKDSCIEACVCLPH